MYNRLLMTTYFIYFDHYESVFHSGNIDNELTLSRNSRNLFCLKNPFAKSIKGRLLLKFMANWYSAEAALTRCVFPE